MIRLPDDPGRDDTLKGLAEAASAFSEFVNSVVTAIADGKVTENVEIYHDWGLTPSSFGEDADGELYVCKHEPEGAAGILKIVAK